jgi:carbon monoxide dehydrogenase subunit G
MHLEGEQEFEAPASTIFDVTLQPEVLEACIPGADEVERTSDTEYEGQVTRGLASITVTMDLEVKVVEDERPDRVVIELEGSDNRTNSTADGTVTVTSTEDGDVTTLSYEADINFTGRLASLGGRLIKRQINKDLQTFFDDLKGEVEAEAEAEAK